jgi:DGQHR domain-containing protein
MSFTLKKIRRNPDGSFSGSATITELYGKLKVDVYNSQINPKGYQRRLDEKRSRRVQEFIINGGRFTGLTIHLSCRKKGKSSAERYEYDKSAETLTILDDCLYVYDGQTRYFGMERVVQREPIEYHDLSVNFSIRGLTQEEEAEEFTRINTEAKSVKHDLTDKNLSDFCPSDERAVIYDALTKLNFDRESPYYNMFLAPETKKERFKFKTPSYVAETRRIYKWLHVHKWTDENATTQEKVEDLRSSVDNYFKAFRVLVPGVFNNPESCIQDPTRYAAHTRLMCYMFEKDGRKPHTEAYYTKYLSRSGKIKKISFWDKTEGDAASYNANTKRMGAKALADNLWGTMDTE